MNMLILLIIVNMLIAPTGYTNEKACSDYAKKAVVQQKENLSLRCGFTGNRWGSDYNGHYNWCLQEEMLKVPNEETTIRQEALNGCRQRRPGEQRTHQEACRDYAKNAVAQNEENFVLGCGLLGGGRWGSWYNEHYNWCLGEETLKKPNEETAIRQEALTQCSQSHLASAQKIAITQEQSIAEASNKKPDTTPPRIIIVPHDSSRGIKRISDARRTIRGQAVDESGVASVLVNNSKVRFDKNGNFSADVFLKPGKNNVAVNAIDIHNNKATKTITIVRESQTNEIAEKEKREIEILGKYYAIVIGINQYEHLSELQTAVNDAKKIGRLLKDNFGFEIRSLINKRASRNSIVKTINEFRKILSSNDKLLIYYAGHGYFDKVTGKAYWLPTDAEKSDDTNWILAERVTSNLKRIDAKQILIVSDSCYSGTFMRTAQVNLYLNEKRLHYIKKMLNKKARVIIASGGNEPVSDSGSKGHSVFAGAFIKALKEMNKKIFLTEELFVGFIKESVAGNADQTPEYGFLKNSGHEGGDFVFIKSTF
jgi:hypothetical protein